MLAWAAVSAGCFLLDDYANDPRHDVRGYTECGSMFGEVEWCQPGQYCEDQTFSDCVNGCLSDVNCASNQYCEVDRRTGEGICLNARTVGQRLVEGAADRSVADEGSGAAALEGSDAQ